MKPVVALALALGVAACGTPSERTPAAPPAQTHDLADVVGFSEIRTFFDGSFDRSTAEVQALIVEQRQTDPADRDFNILVLSGGGADGAYGAGLLKGWTEHGDRPEFDVVTGVSTGALIAPFAFLGPDYDDETEAFYTQINTEDVLDFTIVSAIFGGTAVADTAPLRAILADVVDPDFVAKIAAEHQRGRRLLIATTNLDSQRPVIWDIGAIAVTASPEAPALIQSIMLASASIPGAFPPVLIDVEIDGQRYQEMHVDGGVTLSLFTYPPSVNVGEVIDLIGVPRERRNLYIIRNAKLQPEYDAQQLALLPIAQRSISTLIKSQTIGNILTAEQTAARDGLNIQLAFVPDSFNEPAEELFDPVYMRKLFDLGYREAREGYPWGGSLIDFIRRGEQPTNLDG
ncbi:MAG: patatin-like phospholipase family protein [Pseudomonadota bacterium]